MIKRRIAASLAGLLLLFGALASWQFVRPALAQNARTTRIVPTVIAAGGTFQQILPAGQKFGFFIQNNNATDSCNVIFGTLSTTGAQVTVANGNATAGNSFLLTTGGVINMFSPNAYVPSDPILATCANTSDTLAVYVQ